MADTSTADSHNEDNAIAPSSSSTSSSAMAAENAADDVSKPLLAQRKAYPYIICALATILNANIGYDMGASTSVSFLLTKQTEFSISNTEVELYVGSLYFASIFGGLVANFFADYIGRKGTMWLAEVLFLIGILGVATAQNFAALLGFRLLSGFGFGIGYLMPSLYIGEVAPHDIRGLVASRSELAVNVGLLTAFLVGWAFSGASAQFSWRVIVAIEAVLPIILIIALFFMPESPRWLVTNNKPGQAKDVLTLIHEEHEDKDALVQNIVSAIKYEEELMNQGNGWKEIFCPERTVGYALFVGFGIALCQVMGFSETLTAYYLFIFEAAGVDESSMYLILVLFAVTRIIAVSFATYLFDYPSCGRRLLLLMSGVGIALSLLVLGLVFAAPITAESGRTVVGIFFFYLAVFSLGYGPGPWLILSEVFPLQIRAKAMSLAAVINRGSVAILISTFLTTVRGLNYYGTFFLYFALVCKTILFIFFFLPETRGVSLEDMSTLFGNDEEHRRLMHERSSNAAERADAADSNGAATSACGCC